MKDSTRFRDDEIRKLIETGRYTAKEVASILNGASCVRGTIVTVKQVYHAAYRCQIGFRMTVDRRAEVRPWNPGRRETDFDREKGASDGER